MSGFRIPWKFTTYLLASPIWLLVLVIPAGKGALDGVGSDAAARAEMAKSIGTERDFHAQCFGDRRGGGAVGQRRQERKKLFIWNCSSVRR